MLKRIWRLCQMVWFIPLPQLLARGSTVLTRMFLGLTPSVIPRFILSYRCRTVTKCTDVPNSLFTARCCSVIVDGNRITLEFFNTKRTVLLSSVWKEEFAGNCPSRLWAFQLHSMEFLREVTDAMFLELVVGWINAYPAYTKSYWESSWSSFVVSIRCVVWLQELSRRKITISPDTERLIVDSLGEQIMFLSNNLEYDLKGNHIIKNIKALLWGSYYFQGKASEQWYCKAVNLLEIEINSQILSDGVHFERSPSYHNQVLVDLMECSQVLAECGLKAQLETAINRMLEVSENLAHPDCLPSLFNDGGLRMAYSVERIIEAGRELGLVPGGRKRVFTFPVGGFTGSYFDGCYFVIDHGPIAPKTLPGHGHGDIFSFEMSVNGKRIVVDKGVFEYAQGYKRQESKSTLSHNTLNLDRKEQFEFWGQFRASRLPNVKADVSVVNGKILISGFHDGYRNLAGAPEHHRSFDVLKNEIIVCDWIEGGKGQIAEARILFHPGCDIVITEFGASIFRDDETVQLITTSPLEKIKTNWFPDLGLEQPCDQLVIYYGKGQGPWKFCLSVEKDNSTDSN